MLEKLKELQKQLSGRWFVTSKSVVRTFPSGFDLGLSISPLGEYLGCVGPEAKTAPSARHLRADTLREILVLLAVELFKAKSHPMPFILRTGECIGGSLATEWLFDEEVEEVLSLLPEKGTCRVDLLSRMNLADEVPATAAMLLNMHLRVDMRTLGPWRCGNNCLVYGADVRMHYVRGFGYDAKFSAESRSSGRVAYSNTPEAALAALKLLLHDAALRHEKAAQEFREEAALLEK